MSFDEINKQIEGYLHDEDACYAMALVGEWGSGKTRYCNITLKEHLKSIGWSTCRASLFGVSTTAEVYSKLNAALLSLNTGKGGGPSDNLRAGARTIFKSLCSSVKGFLGHYGVTIPLDSETMFLMLRADKRLLILDDLERCAFQDGGQALLGLVNDLVENHHCKVLLIARSLSDINPEMLEKVVWKVVDFAPTAQELYDAILKSGKGCLFTPPELDDCAVAGIRLSGCLNARALIKAKPLIAAIAASPSLSNEKFALEGRASALAVIMKHVVAAAAVGDGAVEHTELEDNRADESDEVRDSPVPFEDHQKEQENEERALLAGLLGCLKGTYTVDQAIVDRCLADFMETKFPDSPADVELVSVFREIEGIAKLDDAQVGDLAARLSSCILRAGFAARYIVRTCNMNRSLKEIGFSAALGEDEVERCLRTIVDRDPAAAAEALSTGYEDMLYAGTVEKSNVLDELLVRARTCITEPAMGAALVAVKASEASCGKLLADAMRADIKRKQDDAPMVEPEQFVHAFLVSDPQSQEALWSLVRSKIIPCVAANSFVRKNWLPWLIAVRGDLYVSEHASKMSELRARWLMNDIDKIARDYDIAEDDGA